jgi:hypothetical protein
MSAPRYEITWHVSFRFPLPEQRDTWYRGPDGAVALLAYPSAEPYPDGPLVEDESGASRARGSARERRPLWQSRRQVD